MGLTKAEVFNLQLLARRGIECALLYRCQNLNITKRNLFRYRKFSAPAMTCHDLYWNLAKTVLMIQFMSDMEWF